MNCMILAAGLGMRLRPYTETMPKAAIPFMTVPLACYPLSLLAGESIYKLVVNTHHLPKKVVSVFEKIGWPSQELIFSNEPDHLLGSGGGIRKALPHLLGNGDFVVANADEVILPLNDWMMAKVFEQHRTWGSAATLVCMQHPEVGKKFGGVWLGTDSEVECFSKKPVPGLRGLHYLGIVILSERIKKYFFKEPDREENLLYDTLTTAMAAGEQVFAAEIKAKWFEMGNPQDFLQATEYCLQQLKTNSKEPWVRYLQNIIRKQVSGGIVIEKEIPDLEKRLIDFVKKQT